jgi:hypothetical protein
MSMDFDRGRLSRGVESGAGGDRALADAVRYG